VKETADAASAWMDLLGVRQPFAQAGLLPGRACWARKSPRIALGFPKWARPKARSLA